jgi:cytochrome oxidase assembly protein ShyY1
MKVARSEAKENRVLVSALTDGGVSNLGARAVTLSVADQARRLARAMTWFTLGMEAILALLVLVPWARARRAAVRSAVSPMRILTALDRILGH